jgi:hypothetical protein
MTRRILCVSILALAAAAAPANAAEHSATDKPVLAGPSSASGSTEEDCETRMDKLDASQAEGGERLAEKNAVIDYCARQYKNDKTIERLVTECTKYEEQPVVKQQFLADCQLAAFNYGNALSSLKDEYRQ